VQARRDGVRVERIDRVLDDIELGERRVSRVSRAAAIRAWRVRCAWRKADVRMCEGVIKEAFFRGARLDGTYGVRAKILEARLRAVDVERCEQRIHRLHVREIEAMRRKHITPSARIERAYQLEQCIDGMTHVLFHPSLSLLSLLFCFVLLISLWSR